MACVSNLTFTDSQGSTFHYNGVEYGVTSVSLQVEGLDDTDQTIDGSTLSLAFGCCRQMLPPPLIDCGDTTTDGTLTVNFLWTNQLPPTDGEYPLQFPKFNLNQNAICTGYQLDAAVGEYVTGSATFDLVAGTEKP